MLIGSPCEMAIRRLELRHQTEEMHRFNEALHGVLEEVQAPIKSQHTLAVVMEEVVLNVIQHATPPEDLPFTVSMTAEPGWFAASVRDYGAAFDPLSREEPNTTLDIDERPIGGLGILMTKKMMTSVAYRREEGCNCLDLELRW